MSDTDFADEKTLFEVSLSEAFEEYGISADASKEVKPMIRSLFSERHAFPDVHETLRLLSEKNMDFAIGSTTDTDSLLYYLEMNHLCFSNIYTSENMKVYKPNEKFYQTILQRSGWSAEECMFVGDSYVDDVCGPCGVGMKTALLDRKSQYKYAELSPQPNYTIRSLLELLSIIQV